MGIDRKHQPQTYANHSTPLLNIIHISPFSTLVGMTALSRNVMTFAPPEKRLQKRLWAQTDQLKLSWSAEPDVAPVSFVQD